MLVTLGVSASAISGAGNVVARAFAKEPSPAVRSESPSETADTLLDARSPGARNYGWLVQNKSPRTGFDVGPPHERVLTSVRHRPGSPVTPANTPALTPYTPVGGAVDPATPGAIEQALTDDVVPVGPNGVVIPGSPGIGVVSGPGGSGGTGAGGGGNPGGTMPSTPAVPESGTWAMLVLGFFAVGAAMRQRRPVLRHAAS